MDLSIDRTSEVPLGTQLIWKLRTLIAAGRLAPGDRLPGIREVAEAAGVNINTVRSVFARLEEQGLLNTEHGRGTFVAAGVHGEALLAEMADAALAQAMQAGIDPRELAAALYVAQPGASTNPGAETPAVGQERAERRLLRVQIAELEREVATLDPLGTLQPGEESPAPRLLSTAELRSTRDGLQARLEQLRDERDHWRVEAEQLEQEELEAEQIRSARSSRWREGGIWTGGPRVRVSWTSP